MPDETPEQTHPGVFVALYDLTEADERALDAWEGADSGLYQRVHLRTHTLEGDVVAYAYVLDAYEGGLPSARHLGAIADAAEARRRPDRLRHRPALPGVPLHRELTPVSRDHEVGGADMPSVSGVSPLQFHDRAYRGTCSPSAAAVVAIIAAGRGRHRRP